MFSLRYNKTCKPALEFKTLMLFLIYQTMNFQKLLAVGLIALTLVSCSTKRSPLTYFENIDEFTEPAPTGDYLAKIQPGDELFITVTSTIQETTALYNLPLVNPATNALLNVYQTPQQQTYIVDSDGCITAPILGKVHVAGLTTEQIRDKITAEIEKDVNDALVRVELVNFKVDVAGEVARPGTIKITSPRFSILDALSAAGDLTVYGERDNILVIREENGKKITGRINLNDAETLNSPFYYVKQNDYIYVEPNDIRKANSKYNQDNAFKLSVISTIVSAASVIASLVIALTVNK